tara:strand:+ start:365 stop:478 length:114 start_codon:yes stop_codon:yes gene_type:complete
MNRASFPSLIMKGGKTMKKKPMKKKPMKKTVKKRKKY